MMISKEMHKESYEYAISQYLIADNEDERWNARKTLASIENSASMTYGKVFSDSLHRLLMNAINKGA